MNSIYALLLTCLAGASTLLGTFLIFFKSDNNIIIKSISFAAGVMICVSICDLIPSSLREVSKTFYLFPSIIIIGIFITIGIIFSFLIDKYLPDNYEHNNISDKKLYRVGVIAMIAIILHNIPEGIATFLTSNNDLTLGISLTLAIALHNIPEGISISIPIYYATKSRGKAIFYTLISGLSEPLGAILAWIILKPFVTSQIMGFIYAFIAGIMLHISFYELLPNSLKYKQKYQTFIYFVIGIIVMYISHLMLK